MSERNRKQQNRLGLFQTEQWKITVGLQKISGLYCFQRDRINFICWLIIALFSLSFTIVLGIRLVMEIGVHNEIVIENILGELYMLIIFSKLGISVLKRKSFKCIYAKIADHWSMINNAEELDIVSRNMERGHGVVKIYSLYCIIGMGCFIAMPITYPLLDYVIPMENKTRTMGEPAYVEYGLDPEKYYYPLMTQGFVGGLGCIAVFVAFDVSYMMLTNYVIGLFALAKHRLGKVNKLIKAMEQQNINVLKSNWPMPYIVQAIKTHQRALAYANDLEANYNKAWFITLVCDTATIAGCFAILKVKDTPEEIFRFFSLLFGAFIHFYFIFLPGQLMINASEEVFDACYAANWYKLSHKSKYLLKIIMIRSLRASYLTGGKMFSLSMNTYCSVYAKDQLIVRRSSEEIVGFLKNILFFKFHV
ncbi:uncharacterized protein LOC106654538 [Trichogramma pretiosum]|uniref:uncharacterized protein LOC106654538 n=1 Tax=Trichogramma pretiosum TaxID=7493 RepID=UPI0006C96BF4|nr:uncharacterized protein LOC106654538 [Trichogramma pretiosum]